MIYTDFMMNDLSMFMMEFMWNGKACLRFENMSVE